MIAQSALGWMRLLHPLQIGSDALREGRNKFNEVDTKLFVLESD